MRIKTNKIGQKIGKLTIIEFIKYDRLPNKDPVYKFECECGNYRITK